MNTHEKKQTQRGEKVYELGSRRKFPERRRRHLKSRAPGAESSARAPGDFIAEDGDHHTS
jgi:hypothetical protein